MKKLFMWLILTMALIATSVVTVCFCYQKNNQVSDLIAQNDKISITQDFAIPGKTGAIKDDRRGLLIQTTQKADIEFSSKFIGEFSLDFRLFANKTGVNDVSMVTFLFKDTQSDDFFNVYYEMDNSTDVKDGVGRVGVGFPYGEILFYAQDGNIVKGTKQIDGSFANVAAPSSSVAVGQKLKFLPGSMELYYACGEEYIKLIDLDDAKACSSAGLKPVSPFKEYTVTVGLSGINKFVTSQLPASLVLYQLNGQVLSGKQLTDSAAPSVFMPLHSVGVEGYDYELPKAKMFDIVDGEQDFNGDITIFKDGVQITATNGKIKNLQYGTYQIVLTNGVDNQGYVSAETKFNLDVLMLHPGHTLTLDEQLFDVEIGAGASVFLPAAVSDSNVIIGKNKSCPVQLQIKKGAEIIKTVENVTKGFNHTFVDSGAYKVIYTSTDGVGHTKSHEITILVVDGGANFTFGEIPTVLKKGSVYQFPTVKASVGGESVATSVTLTDSVGKQCKSGEVLDRVGYYTITATANKNNITYTATRGFNVKTATDQMFIDKRGSIISSNAKSPDYAFPYQGIEVTATKSNSKVTYKTPIDITKLSKGGDTLIEFLPTPKIAEMAEFGQINIELADVNDPTKSIDVKVHRSYDGGYFHTSLVRAGINKSNYGGWHWGRIVRDEGRGTDMSVSFSGVAAKENSKCATGKIWFDWNEKAFYCALQDMQLLILDLDDQSNVGIGNEWTGFSSNMAYLSVTANTIENPMPTYMITSVMGQPLGGEYQTSKTPIGFNVDYGGNVSAPVGLVGKPYPIFNVMAFDNIDSQLPTKAEVYYAYKNPTLQEKLDVDLQNYSFTPTKKGKHTILYQSANSSYRVDVSIADSLQKVGYTFENGEKLPQTLSLGQTLVIPKVVASGGSGNKTVEFIAELNNKPININERRIKPLEEGNLNITIKVTDYIGQIFSQKLQIAVSISALPVLENEISMPKAILNNKNFQFAPVNAYDYSSGSAVKCEYEIYVTDSSGTNKLDGGKYAPALANNEDVQVEYKIYSANKQRFLSKKYDVKVILPKFKDEYLIKNDSVTVTRSDDGVILETSVDNETISFANSLSAYGFNLKFAVTSAALGRVDFIITDSVNADSRVKFSIVKVNSLYYMEINGVRGGMMTGAFGGDSFEFRIAENGVSVVNKKEIEVGKITTFEGGSKFSGFDSGKVYLDVVLGGVKAPVGLQLISVNGQLFDSYPYDEMRSQIVLTHKFDKSYDINANVTIWSVNVYDVLDPYTEVEVTVQGPRGKEYLKSANAFVNNTINADAYGTYVVTYKSFDSSGNMARHIVLFRVIDYDAPVITVNGTVQESAKVGDIIKLPSATVSDNNQQDLTVYISCADPNGNKVIVDGQFKAEKRGTYVISYFARDGAYNYDRIEYKIFVS